MKGNAEVWGQRATVPLKLKGLVFTESYLHLVHKQFVKHENVYSRVFYRTFNEPTDLSDPALRIEIK